MRLTVGQKLGGGAFGDVYAASDEIGRAVAVKIIRPDDPNGALAIGHAKALAKLDHPNVVRVFSIERIADPAGDTREVTAVVMELIDGPTLTRHLASATIDLSAARLLGIGMLSAVEHMVSCNIAHGDLHTDNVMIADGAVKVIDILLLSHGSQLSSSSLEGRLRRDLLSLRLIIQEILQAVIDQPGLARSFNDSLEVGATLQDLIVAFEATTAGTRATAGADQVEHGIALIVDDGFVAGDDYAKAIASEFSPAVFPALLRVMLERNLCREVHSALVTLLWRETPADERQSLCIAIAARLDADVPKGNWTPPLRLLSSFGSEGWGLLPRRTRLRFEGAVLKDILNGYVDIYAPIRLKGGALGTWALPFVAGFQQRAQLVENIAAMLDGSWYTQNYIGEFFIATLARIAVNDSQRQRLIRSLARAVNNDARLVVRNLGRLPQDWQSAVKQLGAAG